MFNVGLIFFPLPIHNWGNTLLSTLTSALGILSFSVWCVRTGTMASPAWGPGTILSNPWVWFFLWPCVVSSHTHVLSPLNTLAPVDTLWRPSAELPSSLSMHFSLVHCLSGESSCLGLSRLTVPSPQLRRHHMGPLPALQPGNPQGSKLNIGLTCFLSLRVHCLFPYV